MVTPAVIRNCNFILECPARWDGLGPTDQEAVRYCDVCQRKVFMCHTEDELRERIEQNECVAVQLPRFVVPMVGVPAREQDWEDAED